MVKVRGQPLPGYPPLSIFRGPTAEAQAENTIAVTISGFQPPLCPGLPARVPSAPSRQTTGAQDNSEQGRRGRRAGEKTPGPGRRPKGRPRVNPRFTRIVPELFQRFPRRRVPQPAFGHADKASFDPRRWPPTLARRQPAPAIADDEPARLVG